MNQEAPLLQAYFENHKKGKEEEEIRKSSAMGRKRKKKKKKEKDEKEGNSPRIKEGKSMEELGWICVLFRERK